MHNWIITILIILVFLFIQSESYCQESEFEFIPLHFDASFDRYPTDLDGKIVIPSELATDSILLFVKTKIPDLMLNSSAQNGVMKITRLMDKGLRVVLKPGLHELRLAANGFNDTTLTPKFFSYGDFYSLTANSKLVNNDYGVINLISKPDGCEIEINGKLIPFRSPLMVQLKKNESYKIKFINPVHKCHQLEKNISFNEGFKQLNYNLPSIKGFLAISCFPKDSMNANVIIIKNDAAIFDSMINQAKVVKIDTGAYQINVKKAGFLEQERFIQIRPCDTLKCEVRMIKESAKVKKMMLTVTEKDSIFKFHVSELRRIDDWMRKHYQEKEGFYVVPKNQTNQIYKSLKSSGDTLKILTDSRIDILLNCESFVAFEKLEQVGESIIQIDMGVFIVHKGFKKQYIQIINKLNNYFPKRIDAALSFFDNFINDQYRFNTVYFFKSPKGVAIISSALIGTFLIYDSVTNERQQKKLPDAPGFPKK